jgi:hypothetical protein
MAYLKKLIDISFGRNGLTDDFEPNQPASGPSSTSLERRSWSPGLVSAAGRTGHVPTQRLNSYRKDERCGKMRGGKTNPRRN